MEYSVCPYCKIEIFKRNDRDSVANIASEEKIFMGK